VKKTEHDCRDGKKQRRENWEREVGWRSEEVGGTAVGRKSGLGCLGSLGRLGWMEGERVRSSEKSGGRDGH